MKRSPWKKWSLVYRGDFFDLRAFIYKGARAQSTSPPSTTHTSQTPKDTRLGVILRKL